jgi:pyruvate dehydrogenase E1 component alpha subunit
VTYRRGPHSTADDPKRYRSDEELKRWEALDPIARFEKYITAEGALSDEFKKQCEDDAAVVAGQLRKDIVGAGPLDPTLLFENVYAEPTAVLRSQLDDFKRDREID